MNRYGLKAASRQCLADAAIPPRRIVCFYLLCLYIILIPTDIYSHILQTNFAALSGLSAITLKNRYFLLSVIITVLVLIFTFLWGVGFSAYALRLSRKERAGADDLFTGFRMFGKLLWLDVLMSIYVALWLFVFIIPGFIALYRYRMAVYVLLDHPDYTASQALRESCVLTDGHKWELFKLDLSFLWYYLLSRSVRQFSISLHPPDHYPKRNGRIPGQLFHRYRGQCDFGSVLPGLPTVYLRSLLQLALHGGFLALAGRPLFRRSLQTILDLGSAKRAAKPVFRGSFYR